MNTEKDNNSGHKSLSIDVGWFLLLLFFPVIYFIYNSQANDKALSLISESKDSITYWQPTILYTKNDLKKNYLIEYGKELIVHTSKYIGPNGIIAQKTNGMNCQNCHLEAGTKVFGNNYGSVKSMYPKFRARSGSVEDIYKRINDCIERSLNGKALDTTSKEMQALKSYIEALGANVPKDEKAIGSGLKDLKFLDRACDLSLGKMGYEKHCVSCHNADGQGKINESGNEYVYPPLWGRNSYNDGAGLYRVSNFAKYIKYNMPFGIDHKHPTLTDEEAWDIAAYVNSQPRPHIDVPNDWPDLAKKPIDHAFGPYADAFDEKQHKYGPFKPIKMFYDQLKK